MARGGDNISLLDGVGHRVTRQPQPLEKRTGGGPHGFTWPLAPQPMRMQSDVQTVRRDDVGVRPTQFHRHSHHPPRFDVRQSQLKGISRADDPGREGASAAYTHPLHLARQLRIFPMAWAICADHLEGWLFVVPSPPPRPDRTNNRIRVDGSKDSMEYARVSAQIEQPIGFPIDVGQLRNDISSQLRSSAHALNLIFEGMKLLPLSRLDECL